MSDYPSTSPFGPHGPQVGAHDVTPNPTMHSAAVPDFSTPAYPATSSGSSAGYSGGGASYTGASFPVLSFGQWMRNLAIGGGVLGCLVGLARGWLLHVPPPVLGVWALRLAIAGAATGAGIAPFVRAGMFVLRAALWIALAVALWAIAAAAAGQLGWLTRWL